MRKQIAEADPRPFTGSLDSTLGEDSAGGGSRIRCHPCIIIMGSSLPSNWAGCRASTEVLGGGAQGRPPNARRSSLPATPSKRGLMVSLNRHARHIAMSGSPRNVDWHRILWYWRCPWA